MELDEILQLADEQGIDFLPGDVLAAISAIGSAASVDRKNPQALAAHNASVLAAHDAGRVWSRDPSDGKVEVKIKFLNTATLGESLPLTASAALHQIFPGAEGHTKPIDPTDRGTGLLRQGKTPNYRKDGHVF